MQQPSIMLRNQCKYAIVVCRSPSGDDVTFEEFVQYVIQEARLGSQHLDFHWMPQYTLCQPCHINYDFVGHYETLHSDAQHLIRHISRLTNYTNTHLHFPATDPDNRNRNSAEFLRKFYGNISTNNIVRLLKLYRKDYGVFGYKLPEIARQKLNMGS